jgi:glycerophosphoryl diester phosphodiesterase
VFRDEPEIARKVVDIIRSEAFEKECIVTSFDRKIVEKVKQIAPDIKTGFIFNKEYPLDVFEGSWDALCCNYRIVNKEFVLKAKNSHKIIYVWTVNRKEEMRRLIDLKVDGIITNVPDLLKEVVNKGTIIK